MLIIVVLPSPALLPLQPLFLDVGPHPPDKAESGVALGGAEAGEADVDAVVLLGDDAGVDVKGQLGRHKPPHARVGGVALPLDIAGGHELLHGLGGRRLVDLEQHRQLGEVDARVLHDAGKKGELTPLEVDLPVLNVGERMYAPRHRADFAEDLIFEAVDGEHLQKKNS